MPRRNRRPAARFTDAGYGYGTGLKTTTCPRCPATFTADTKGDADGALQDHLANAHDQEGDA